MSRLSVFVFPSKWPIVGALPAQYLGRGPGPCSINRASHHSIEASGITPPKGQHHQKNIPREAILPSYCSSAPEANHTPHTLEYGITPPWWPEPV